MAGEKEYFCETTEQVYNILENLACNGTVLIDEEVSKMLTLQALSTKTFDEKWNQILYAEFKDESVTFMQNADPKLITYIRFGKKMKVG